MGNYFDGNIASKYSINYNPNDLASSGLDLSSFIDYPHGDTIKTTSFDRDAEAEKIIKALRRRTVLGRETIQKDSEGDGTYTVTINGLDPTTIRDFSALISVMFSRWLAMNFADVLIKQDGIWYAKQFKHFEKEVLPKWVNDDRTIDYIKYL